jgi:glutamate--cysteine ligase catalytic subunit
METAHHVNAVLSKKFWFRKNLFPTRTSTDNDEQIHTSSSPTAQTAVENDYTLMTIDEIMNGRGNEFVGLLPLIEGYLNTVNVDIATRQKLDRYLSLISKRASGELQTGARWIREFVQSSGM